MLFPSAIVLCGSYEMDWLSFQMAGHLISSCSFLPVRDMGNRLYSIRSAELMYKDGKAELATLVYLFPSCRATDPRDHIYGLLGMIGPRNIGRASPKAHAIKPDYTKTTEAIFTEAATHILCDYGNTDLLRLVPPKQLQRLGDMPSWVPDFSDISEPCNINSYNAPLADLLEEHVHNTVLLGVLSMRGIIVDTVVYTTIDISPATVERILLNVYAEAYRSPNPYKTGESCVDALWRTLIADMTLDTRKKAPIEYRQSFVTWICRVRLEEMGLSAEVIHHNPPLRSLLTAHPKLAEMFPHHVKGGADVHTLVGSVPILHKMYNSASREDETYRVTALERLYVLQKDDTSGQCGTKKFLVYDSQASTPEDSSLSGASDNSASSQDEGRIENRSTLCSRAFFITKNGYYGLGPLGRPGAVESDTVVVPARAYSPYVLRPIRDGRYVLVGGAYVHGISDISCLNKNDLPEIPIFNLV